MCARLLLRYLNGHGLKKDPKKGLELLTKAAKQKHGGAQTMLDHFNQAAQKLVAEDAQSGKSKGDPGRKSKGLDKDEL